MDQYQKQRLKDLQMQLQLKLGAETFVKNTIEPFLEILDAFHTHNTLYSIMALANLPEELQHNVKTFVSEEPYCIYGFNEAINTFWADEQLEQLWERYPNDHPLRYVPQLPQIAIPPNKDEHPLQYINETHCLPDQEVFLYFLSYSPFLKVSLYELAALPKEILFNFWHGDVVIFPENMNWLIAFSLEEEWYVG